MGAIRMLANAIDEKDPYTRGHSERVAFYSQLIARHLGMSEEEVERVHLSGIIHDVGKIGIEDRILRKPAALTDEEYEIMKQHPRKGEHILDAVPLLKEMAGAALMHHENWDGSGYPDGLEGRGDPAARAHRERGRRLRRHDHRPPLLQGHDVRGGAGPAAFPGRQEVRRRMRGRHREGRRRRRPHAGQGQARVGGRAPGRRGSRVLRTRRPMTIPFLGRGLWPCSARAVAAGANRGPESRASTRAQPSPRRPPGMALEAFKKAVHEDAKNPYFYKGLGLAYLATPSSTTPSTPSARPWSSTSTTST